MYTAVDLVIVLAIAVMTLAGLWQRQQLRRLRAVLDGIDEGVLLIDNEDRLQLWNAPLLRLRGVDATRLRPGLEFADFLACAQPYRGAVAPAAVAPNPWHHDLAAGERRTREVELASGRMLQITATRLGGEYTLLTYADVAAIRQSQLAFRDLATRLAATLDGVLDSIITINDRGVIDSFSAGAEQMFGYTAKEVIGQNVKLLMPDSHAMAHDGYLSAYRETGVPHIMRKRREVEARTKFGRVFPIELGVSEMRVAGRRMFIGVIRDITERRHVERVQQEFVATVSHELRTPLTSVIGSLDLAQQLPGEPLGPKAQRLLAIGAQNGRRLQHLIDDILDAAKCSAECLVVALEPMAVSPVVQQSVQTNQAFAARFNVRLVIEGAESEASARIDAGRLEQVMSNLINNAIKFSHQGEVVTVRLKAESGSVVLEVCDCGSGIPESFRPFVYQKFSQANASDARPKNGTGLGLYIARSLVERMAGQIEFESVPGAGTTFRVTLPSCQERLTQALAAHPIYGETA